MPAEMSYLSTEYVDVPITSNITLEGGTAQVAFLAGANTTPVDADWVNATLVVASASSAKARVLVGPFGGEVSTLTTGDYQEWIRVTAVGSPERPVRKAGVLTIT